MQVYWSEQYTFDFSSYLRHIFTVKHIYLTLYIAYTYHVTSTYSVPLYLARSARLPVLAPASVWPSYLRPDRFQPIVMPAPVCARPRACVRACAWALSAYLPVACRAFHSPIMYILRRYARLARRVVRSAHSAANFFEIVFGLSISIPPSSAGVGGTTLYCYTG